MLLGVVCLFSLLYYVLIAIFFCFLILFKSFVVQSIKVNHKLIYLFAEYMNLILFIEISNFHTFCILILHSKWFLFLFIKGEHVYEDVLFFGYTPADILDAVKDFQVRNDDVIIATYPKAGNLDNNIKFVLFYY
jgi:hypothetical protein